MCFARNCLIRTFAASSGAPSFHSVMNSELGSSFAVSSEIGRGCASSLPASTRHGVLQLHELAVDAVEEAGVVEVVIERIEHLLGGLRMVLEALRPRVESRGAAGLHGAHAPDGLRDHGARDALGLGLQQAHDEGPADALAVQVAALDAQVVEQGDVVGGVGVPAVLCGDGRARPAAGIALIHHDHAVVRRELGDRVHGCGGAAPDVDRRLQARRREREDGEPLPYSS